VKYPISQNKVKHVEETGHLAQNKCMPKLE